MVARSRGEDSARQEPTQDHVVSKSNLLSLPRHTEKEVSLTCQVFLKSNGVFTARFMIAKQ